MEQAVKLLVIFVLLILAIHYAPIFAGWAINEMPAVFNMALGISPDISIPLR